MITITSLRGMRDRSMRSGTELAREIQLTDWSIAGNLSTWSSGAQMPRDICTRCGRYLYATKCSWMIKVGSQSSCSSLFFISSFQFILTALCTIVKCSSLLSFIDFVPFPRGLIRRGKRRFPHFFFCLEDGFSVVFRIWVACSRKYKLTKSFLV